MRVIGICKALAAGISLAALVSAVIAQDYPQRPLRMIVAFPPGGVTDILARIVGAKLGERFSQQVVIDNRAGASGMIGHDIVAKSQPDGYTLLMCSPTLSTNGSLYSKVPHDAVRDFAPIALVAATPLILVAHPSLPVKSVADLIAYAKANPGKLSFGASSPGTLQHLAGELLKRTAGIDVLYVPYKGTGALMPDLLGGRLNFAFESVPTMAPHIKAGTLRGLAVTSMQRSAAVPNLPTVIEAGLPGFAASGWYGVLAAAKTPPQIVNRLHREITAIIGEADVRDRLLAQGADPLTGTPGDFRKFLVEEVDKWGKVIRQLGLKIE